jgi:IS605 OrfB family transposase
VAKALADHQSELAGQLHRLWAKEWSRRQDLWRRHLRWLRRFILPRKKDMLERGGDVRRVGGLSVKRLQTIRDLYQLLKAFRMRPEPDDLRKNVPELGDESLAEFGRRILNQLERLREQRVKQLASRVVEAAVGGGRMTRSCGRDRKRPAQNMDRPCHVVVVENLERYKPEDSRLRRENRQIMNWAARNVRKYIMEGCELHGVYFTEVPPAYTSRQDSRTGAPGIRCEDVSSEILREAVRRATAKDGGDGDSNPDAPQSRFEREVSYWTRVIQRAKQDETTERQRDRVLAAIAATIPRMSDLPATFRLPHRGGELFVSAAEDSPIAKGIQADLNAASNIGLKALNDPDWEGAWWYVLVNLATGRPTPDKVKGSAVWKTEPRILEGDPDTEMVQDAKTRRKRRRKTDVYAFNPLLAPDPSLRRWMTTKNYWAEIERLISDRLIYEQGDNPF